MRRMMANSEEEVREDSGEHIVRRAPAKRAFRKRAHNNSNDHVHRNRRASVHSNERNDHVHRQVRRNVHFK